MDIEGPKYSCARIQNQVPGRVGEEKGSLWLSICSVQAPGGVLHIEPPILAASQRAGVLITISQAPLVVSSCARTEPGGSDSKSLCSFPYSLVPHVSRTSCPHNLTHPDHSEEPEGSRKELRTTQMQTQSPHNKVSVKCQENVLGTLG